MVNWCADALNATGRTNPRCIVLAQRVDAELGRSTPKLGGRRKRVLDVDDLDTIRHADTKLMTEYLDALRELRHG